MRRRLTIVYFGNIAGATGAIEVNCNERYKELGGFLSIVKLGDGIVLLPSSNLKVLLGMRCAIDSKLNIMF
jgi:hypothetical protein